MGIEPGGDEGPDLPEDPGTSQYDAAEDGHLEVDHEGFLNTQRGERWALVDQSISRPGHQHMVKRLKAEFHVNELRWVFGWFERFRFDSQVLDQVLAIDQVLHSYFPICIIDEIVVVVDKTPFDLRGPSIIVGDQLVFHRLGHVSKDDPADANLGGLPHPGRIKIAADAVHDKAADENDAEADDGAPEMPAQLFKMVAERHARIGEHVLREPITVRSAHGHFPS